MIGAGVAGLRAAIELAATGHVIVAAKDRLRESSSEYAQGGIAAALADDDDIALHEEDTLFAGDGLCNREAVHTLVADAPAAIEQLIDWGAEFDREGTQLLFAREGAHSRSRVLHAHGDSTGREIARTLYEKAASLANVEFRSFAAMTDLIRGDDGSIAGALVLDEKSRDLIPITANAVLLATGGLGRVFKETTNPDVATGDGVAAAYRAGAVISDIEFVQFHPTALHVPGAPRFLLSEALRGEGAYLRNEAGDRFMERYHPLRELAPRDVVSRSIAMELQRSGGEHVYLDLRHVDPDHIRARFPRIYSTCLRLGYDITGDLVPVHPAAHYAMGGVRTDLDGRTSLERLYAAGEAACTGVHGANRLASNSLLEGVVFGARAGRVMRELRARSSVRPEPVPDPGFPTASEAELRETAWSSCGILRSRESLQQALRTLSSDTVAQLDPALVGSHEVRNIATVARLIAGCALARRESRGGHYRTDYPEHDPLFEKHSVISKGSEVSFE